MRHSKITFLSLLIFFLIISGCVSSMLRYKNAKEGFSLLLPKGWEITEGSYNMKVMVRAPEKAGKYRANFLLSISDLKTVEARLGRKLSFPEFYEINKAILLEALPGVKYSIKEDSIFLGLLRGKIISFKIRFEDTSLEYLIGTWVINGRAYTITASAEAEKFKTYQPIFDKVIHSLRVN
jgi:hypothetical protein